MFNKELEERIKKLEKDMGDTIDAVKCDGCGFLIEKEDAIKRLIIEKVWKYPSDVFRPVPCGEEEVCVEKYFCKNCDKKSINK